VPRVVLDTTILISAFLNRAGLCGEIVDLAGRDFVLVLSAEIIAEARRKLLGSRRIRKKARYADEEVRRFCEGLEELAEMIIAPPARRIVRDPNDDMIVACALAGRAESIVTRDEDLLSLGTVDEVEMVTPERFRHRLSRNPASGPVVR
jgi:hypothetical protein